MKITKRTIDAATYTGTNNARCILWDDTISGFGCRIYPSGKKSFVLSYRKDGRKRLYTIGKYGSITLDQARRQAQKQIANIIDGLDPLKDRVQGRSGETMADLCTHPGSIGRQNGSRGRIWSRIRTNPKPGSTCHQRTSD